MNKTIILEDWDKIHGHLQIEKVWKDPSKDSEIIFDESGNL